MQVAVELWSVDKGCWGEGAEMYLMWVEIIEAFELEVAAMLKL